MRQCLHCSLNHLIRARLFFDSTRLLAIWPSLIKSLIFPLASTHAGYSPQRLRRPLHAHHQLVRALSGFNELPGFPDRFSPLGLPSASIPPPEELKRCCALRFPKIAQIVARVRCAQHCSLQRRSRMCTCSRMGGRSGWRCSITCCRRRRAANGRRLRHATTWVSHAGSSIMQRRRT